VTANSSNGAQLLRTYYYDTNPLDSTGTFSQNPLGRLTAVQYPQSAAGVQINDMYSYSQAGLPADKRLQVNQLVNYVDNNNHNQHQTVTVNLDSTYAYNNEGKITAITYPSTIGVGGTSVPGTSYNYIYDGMYRLGAMTDSNNNTIVSGVSYNAANQLLGMTFNGIGETRGYNVLNQLTSIVAGSSENLTYNYPTGANNGKAGSMYNALSGETVTYTYDSLNRMATAAGSGWGEAYTFDGFGNLTTKKVTAGSGPSLSASVNPANNQLQGYGFNYDANGNAVFTNSNNVTAYDVENHISGVGYNNLGAPATTYAYDAQNHRFFMWTAGTVDQYNNATSYSVVAYSPSGQKLGTYLFAPQQPSYQHGPYAPYMLVTLSSSDQYFGGRRLAALDQLGSAGTYYPWGEAKGGTNPQDTWSYATYWRDSATGLDYANNRYYSNQYGRFMTPDPYQASGSPSDPQTWNRYAYTGGDPVNRIDPGGMDFFSPVDPGSCGASSDPNYLSCDPGGPGFCDASQGPGFCDGILPGGDDAGRGPINPYWIEMWAVFLQIRAQFGGTPPPAPAPPDLSVPNCVQSLLSAFNLDYSQLLYKQGTQSTRDHIIERHMNGTVSGTSQYYTTFFAVVRLINIDTFLFGTQQYNPINNTIVFTWTYPDVPLLGVPAAYYIGTDKTGAQTSTNRLVLKMDCKTVITSYPIPGND
jgi:RHS repeat-associated protein